MTDILVIKSLTEANLTSYVGGDIVVTKWPYDPANPFYSMAEGESI